jgi:Protein involved in biosynthesis of mitomycin antibiotics/polyketide fumonisin
MDKAPTIFHDAKHNAQFIRDGYVILDLVDTDHIDRLITLFEANQQEHTSGFSATILSPNLTYREAIHQAIAPLLEKALAAHIHEYRQVCCGFTAKQPSANESAMPLHQDITMVDDQSARPGISLWLPLVDVDEMNGCLQVVTGSHILNCQPRAPGTPFPARNLEAEIRADYLRDLPMRKGQGLIMAHTLFHASGPNCGAVVRPVATSVLAPNERSLVYYHRVRPNDASDDVLLQAYEVDDNFLRQHRLGLQPADGVFLQALPEYVESITLQSLQLGHSNE